MLANVYHHTKLEGKISDKGYTGSLCQFLSKPILELSHSLNVKESLGFSFIQALWEKINDVELKKLKLDDLNMTASFTNTDTEKIFFLVSLYSSLVYSKIIYYSLAAKYAMQGY